MCNCKLKRQYEPTRAEHIASILTHAVMVPVAFAAGIVLISKSAHWSLFLLAMVYGICLVSLFTISSAFHVVYFMNSDINVIDKMCKVDRATIYLFMAATYSPWLFLHPTPQADGLLWNMRWLVWLVAFLGFTFELTISNQFPVMAIGGYLVYGLMPTFILDYQMGSPSVNELKFAGVVYLLGFLFFKTEGTIPFAHAIWHICVILGASLHYMTVYNHFYSETAVTDMISQDTISVL